MRYQHLILILGWCCWLILPSQAQESTPEAITEPLSLIVWLPDLLVPPENTLANAVITEQIATFTAREANIAIETRLKRVGEIGGIMSTLRAASAVAPGAMPDITLLRRADLIAAHRDGFIQSLEGELSSALVSSLDTALKLGQINGTLYGTPYLIELLHLVYRDANNRIGADTNWNYDTVFDLELPITFAAGRSTGLNEVVYLQYIAAGGTFSPDGKLMLNPAALLDVFEYYARLRDADLIDVTSLNYAQIADYLPAFVAGDLPAAVLMSSNYLQMLPSQPRLETAPLPTTTGQPMSLMNGWMWVLVADEPEKQAAALRFMNHMMQAENQTAYARTIHGLPSQRQALLATLPNSSHADLYPQLLDNSVLPLTDSEGGTLARAIQDAFVAVMNGETPATAVEAVVSQQSG